jgi:hypothetical protein
MCVYDIHALSAEFTCIYSKAHAGMCMDVYIYVCMDVSFYMHMNAGFFPATKVSICMHLCMECFWCLNVCIYIHVYLCFHSATKVSICMHLCMHLCTECFDV